MYKEFFKTHRTMKKTIQISNGPSREELFDGLRLFSEKRMIPFCVQKDSEEKHVAALINAIEAEDGSGQSWNLQICLNKKFLSDQFFTKSEKKELGVVAKKVDFTFFRKLIEERYPMPEMSDDLVRVKVYYSTKTRKGVISFEE